MKGIRPALLAALAVLAGCWQPRPTAQIQVLIRRLQSPEVPEREEAFRELLRLGPAALPVLKASLRAGARGGYPLVAVLYAQGEGDAVPLELRARHLGTFLWPRAGAEENVLLEPYVWNELERDLVRAGRPALRLLARALAQDTPTEAKALQVLRVMILIGGRAAAEELARLLDRDRPLDGIRVCDAAAAGLLYLGFQEAALGIEDPEARLRTAREWWARANAQPETEWLREGVSALAERWTPGDPEGVRPLLELLTGRRIEDPKAWREANRDWTPAAPPLRPQELLPILAEEGPAAFDANRRLEAAAGVRLQAPHAATLAELRAARRRWRPDPALAVQWRRYLESTNLRLSAALIAPLARPDPHPLVAGVERQYHATEDEVVTVARSGPEGSYLLSLQSRELGTRLFFGEQVATASGERVTAAELPVLRPAVVFTPLLKACIAVMIEEIPGPQPPRSPEALWQAVRTALREAARGAPRPARRDLLRALAYGQDPADLEFLREQGEAEALLLMGDPEVLPRRPRLEPYEIEIALRKAQDPRTKEYLESLRREAPGGTPAGP